MSARAARAGDADADADQTVRLAAPSPRAVVRIVAIVVACAVLLYLAWRLRDVLRLVVISVFLALALLPVVDAIDARVRVPRAAIILSLYAALAAGVIVVGVVVVPSMVKEVLQLSRDAPRYEQEQRDVPPLRRPVPHRRQRRSGRARSAQPAAQGHRSAAGRHGQGIRRHRPVRDRALGRLLADAQRASLCGDGTPAHGEQGTAVPQAGHRRQPGRRAVHAG